MESKGKLLIFSAPSGAGKTTLVHHIMHSIKKLSFSISATSRPKRGNEVDGKEYYFLSVDDFRKKIANDEFVEWEEVYDGKYYGTLKSEVDRITNLGDNVVFDVDVVGGLNIKKIYGDKALAVFIMPPNIDELDKRLINRNTDSKHDIETRISKAKYELTFADKFDISIINDDLEIAKKEAMEIVSDFVNK
ncbi:MAG: guanylate kinase [Lentimicrobiaceae bacterium]|jgi:guanylate kinase|nr:guanylate kinase [Lentimicrobiaceae bacterium]MCP4909701.1 guanylate kinase [Bacteroidota bacterium]MBT3454708.1 guanylate kinase [Lentimicrobiaceae bacterium]MBT3819688.1 guanylate kinase [Lentimicrobiaceae bacterium]MBT4061234.1 guanylate kinase [Lentimicrobiaceae bacterium]